MANFASQLTRTRRASVTRPRMLLRILDSGYIAAITENRPRRLVPS